MAEQASVSPVQRAEGQPPDRPRVSVVIPVYFNEESLTSLFTELNWLEGELDARGLDLELILVDDGSKDHSWAVLTDFKRRRPTTRLIRLARNFGAVAASNTGFQFVTGDCFTVLSADLQEPIEQVLEMVEKWIAGDRFVISVRMGREDPPITKALAAAYYKVVRRLVLETYPQGGFDLMLMDRAMLPYLQQSSVHTNPNMFAYWLGFQPVALPYQRRKRPFGKSRWTVRKKLTFFIDTVTGFSVVPIRLVSLAGVMTAVISAVYGIWIALNALFGRIDVSGFSTIVVLISFFSGLILFSLGIIGEYLWRIFDSVLQKPKSVIAEAWLDADAVPRETLNDPHVTQTTA
jgi:dolichol-phosphate mannosyltransferase